MQQFAKNKMLIIPWLANALLQRYLSSQKEKIVRKILKTIEPSMLFTDQSLTDRDYLPEILRSMAIKMEIPVYIFTHGAAAGLHSTFSEFTFDAYAGCTVLACSEREPRSKDSNRIILGDMSSSYPYVHFINQQDFCDIKFMDHKKYKVGFLVGGTMFTSTNGWNIMQEIIIGLSESPDVAIVLKLHPREAPFIDLRMIEKFNNLLIVNRETDRSRVSKWADIVVCSDHCSTIFEPMILGKKVVAVQGKHIPRYADIHSCIRDSSVKHISSSSEFELNNILHTNSKDQVTNTVAWGGNGPVDLGELFMNKILKKRI